MSYCYFLFIFSWYVKPNLISEKFEAIFVKHFLPWNLTASKRCSSQIGPETPQKILCGAFSMPKSNSKHTRKWWDSFLLFWLGANRLPRTCELRIVFLRWSNHRCRIANKNSFIHFIFSFSCLAFEEPSSVLIMELGTVTYPKTRSKVLRS